MWKQLIIFILFFHNGNAQRIGNYVANGSFEERYDCTSISLMKAKYWLSIDSSSYGGEYTSVCNGRVPLNAHTYQYPKNGDAYIISGFYILNSIRGYPKNRLKSTLQIGKTYCVKFHVNITNMSPRGIDGFGAYFGGNEIDTITHCTIPLSYVIPQVKNPFGNVISDTLNWVAITGTFTSNGTEKYLLLGNFLADNAVSTVSINTPYYPQNWTDVGIDDVSCIEVDLSAYAGRDTTVYIGDSAYIGREPDFVIDTGCVWYQLPNTTTAIDTVSGMWVKPNITGTYTYVVRQELECSAVKWDTVVVTVRDYDTGIGEVKSGKLEIKFYPNPAQNKITIKSNKEREELSLSIVDLTGRVIIEQNVIIQNYSADMDLHIADGAYMINIRGNKRRTTIKKLLIAR